MSPRDPSVAIIDTHVHLDDAAFDGDRESVISGARGAGVQAFVNIGYSPERWESSSRLRAHHPDVAISIGLHPHLADHFDATVARKLEDAVERLRPVALGEMGLDFVPGNPTPDLQERAFRAQLALASSVKLPLIIHQRAAADELAEVIDDAAVTSTLVLHSFDGTPRLRDWAVERRAYVGIGGLATRRSSKHLRDLLATISPDRLVLETDAPYLVPASVKDRRNVPANIPFIAEQLAPLWGFTADELCRITTVNAGRLFGQAFSPTIQQQQSGEQGFVETVGSD